MKQINIKKHIAGKKKLGKGLAGFKGEQGTPKGAFGGKSKFQKKLDKHGQSAIMDGMNYCETEHEHIDYQAQLASERDMNPCDIHWAKYLLHDNASPSESPLYFRTLKGAYTWAQNTIDYAHGEWSVFELGGQVL